MADKRPYPASRPFPAKFPGACAYSGVHYRTGETIRCIIDSFDPDTKTEVNSRFVLERFVRPACETDRWTRLDWKTTVESLVTEGCEFYLMDKRGVIGNSIEFKNGKYGIANYAFRDWRSPAQMRRTFATSVALLFVPKDINEVLMS